MKPLLLLKLVGQAFPDQVLCVSDVCALRTYNWLTYITIIAYVLCTCFLSDDLKPVIRKRKMLKSTFKSLVSDTRKEMKSKYKVSEFRESFIHGLSYSLKTKQKKYFKDAHLSTLSTFDDIFSAFNNYWDYLNYGLLDIIVKKYLKRPKLVTKMNEYGDDVKAFRSATAVKVFQRAQKSKPLIEPPGFRLVASKHDISPDATLEEIHNLHLRMTQEAELEMFALSIPEVMIGSVFITWLVPESAINDLMFVLTPPLLKELHIEAITRRHSTPLTKQPSRKEMAVSILYNSYTAGARELWDLDMTHANSQSNCRMTAS